MTRHSDALRLRLALGPNTGTQMAKDIGLSQPTVTRALAAMGDEVIKTGQRKSTRYFLRDHRRGYSDIPLYQVDVRGKVSELGVLSPVRPEGYLWTPSQGHQLHSEGLPWWLMDVRPQGFLGRAYAARWGAELGLPSSLQEWSDHQAMRALLAHGHDLVGHVLIGSLARDKFLASAEPTFIREADKPSTYARMAIDASAGHTPGSSAGGEQPKFTAYAESAGRGKHVIVKFSEPLESSNSRRWRDLLWAEHLALTTLREAGVSAAQSAIYDHQAQRFLEVERFDRVGASGRQAMVSLAALDAEFVGLAHQPWPVITQALAKQGVITQAAAEKTEILWAFGALTGNTDMHHGNLSFLSSPERPHELAPAYDMTPMSFAPTRSGRLPDAIEPITLHHRVSHASWRKAREMAATYLSRLQGSHAFSPEFQVCLQALEAHLQRTSALIDRLV